MKSIQEEGRVDVTELKINRDAWREIMLSSRTVGNTGSKQKKKTLKKIRKEEAMVGKVEKQILTEKFLEDGFYANNQCGSTPKQFNSLFY